MYTLNETGTWTNLELLTARSNIKVLKEWNEKRQTYLFTLLFSNGQLNKSECIRLIATLEKAIQ